MNTMTWTCFLTMIQSIHLRYLYFSKNWDFKHSKCSPHYPQLTGFIERSIQTVKQVFSKAKDTKEDPYLSLSNLNIAPGSDGKLPAMRQL